MKPRISFDRGKLLCSTECASYFSKDSDLFFDSAEELKPMAYRDVLLSLHHKQVEFDDKARRYSTLDLDFKKNLKPFDHQQEALQAWLQAKGRGVVALPTGAGKTMLALMVMAQVKRSTFIVVPTIDLMRQWSEVISEYLGVEPGFLGGGQKNVQPITIATYDSAAIYVGDIGDLFGLLICDECHHLPTQQYSLIAEQSIAPYRLGLSATVEREDGQEEKIFELLGEKVFESKVADLPADVLAPFKTVTKVVKLSQAEREEYERSRGVYSKSVKSQNINLRSPYGWRDFLSKAQYLPGGREALKAHRNQRKIAQAASAKLDEIWSILSTHSQDRVIIFTDDNELAYQIGRELILPVITHQTKPQERKIFLENFKTGAFKVLVSSKVLNEGVNVPDANIGVIVSGSSSSREYIQRLGRVLRAKPGKSAILYELVSGKTSERQTHWRRKRQR